MNVVIASSQRHGHPAVAAPPPGRWHRLAFAVAAIEVVILFAPTVRWLFERWTLSVWHNAHGLFIPPVVAYLIYEELRRHPAHSSQSSRWGFAFLVPALLLHALDAGMHTQLLSAIALVMTLPGIALLLLGVERTLAIAFPLAFTLFALPIPLAFTEQIHLLLRHLTTAAVSFLMSGTSYPIFVQGTSLVTADGVLQVADACSGFSTLYAAVAFALLVAYDAETPRRRLLVLLAAAPVAITVNVLRVFALILLALWQGFEILETFVHSASGLLTFVVALPIIYWLGSHGRSSKSPAGRAAPQV